MYNEQYHGFEICAVFGNWSSRVADLQILKYFDPETGGFTLKIAYLNDKFHHTNRYVMKCHNIVHDYHIPVWSYPLNYKGNICTCRRNQYVNQHHSREPLIAQELKNLE